MDETTGQVSLLDMPKLSASNNVQYLTPQMAQQLANISYAPGEQSALQEQLQQAIALRGGEMPQRTQPLSSVFDGVGKMARTMASFQKENSIRGQQKGLLDQQKTAYGEYLKQLAQAQALRNGGQPPPAQQDPAGLPAMDMDQT